MVDIAHALSFGGIFLIGGTAIGAVHTNLKITQTLGISGGGRAHILVLAVVAAPPTGRLGKPWPRPVDRWPCSARQHKTRQEVGTGRRKASEVLVMRCPGLRDDLRSRRAKRSAIARCIPADRYDANYRRASPSRPGRDFLAPGPMIPRLKYCAGFSKALCMKVQPALGEGAAHFGLIGNGLRGAGKPAIEIDGRVGFLRLREKQAVNTLIPGKLCQVMARAQLRPGHHSQKRRDSRFSIRGRRSRIAFALIACAPD